MHCILFLERPLLLFSQDWLAQEVFFFLSWLLYSLNWSLFKCGVFSPYEFWTLQDIFITGTAIFYLIDGHSAFMG